MKVLVTGGTGDVGRAAVARLVEHGHEVRVIGRSEGITIEGADYRACDIMDFEGLQKQVAGMDAVVHLAAIRHPSMAPGETMFRINCSGTFNVYRAAANAGVQRVVNASSINALGYNFGTKDFELRYFPIDEDHYTYTTDPYSFSKQIIEEVADYFWRREGISGISMRLPAVYELTPEKTTMIRGFLARSRQACAELVAMPEPARSLRVQEIVDQFEALRAQRAWEYGHGKDFRLDVPDAPIMFGRSNFWASIDARDSAQAIEKGLLVDYEGSHPVYVNDSHNWVGIPSETLLEVFFPEVEERTHPLEGTETLVSIDKVRALIGYEPEYSIENQIGGIAP